MQATPRLTAKKKSQYKQGMGPAIDLYLSENDRLVPRLDLCMKGSKYVNDAGLVVEVSHNGLTSFISLVLCMTDRKDTFAIIADKTDHTRVQQCKICSKRPRPLLDLSDFSYEQDTQTLRLRLWVTEMCLHVDPKKMGGAPSIHFYFSVSVCLPPPLFPLSHRTSALSDGTPGIRTGRCQTARFPTLFLSWPRGKGHPTRRKRPAEGVRARSLVFREK